MPAWLAVADWKKLAKEHPEAAKADAVPKALEAFAKAKGDDDESLDAIKLVVTKAEAAKKSAKAKEVVGYLEKLIKEAGDEQKGFEAKLKARGAGGDEDSEDGSEGKQLKGQLKRALRASAEEPRSFVVALGKVSGLVLPKGPAVAGEHKKRARAMRTGNGKLLTGRCYGEAGKLVFEFAKAPPGGMAKTIKKAAFIHAELVIGVKVRGPGVEIDDENDIDEIADLGTDGDEADDDLTAAESGGATGDTATNIPVPPVADKPEGPTAEPTTDAPTVTATPPAGKPPVSLVALQQSRLVWEATLKKVRADGVKLTSAMVDRFDGESDQGEAQRAAGRVDESLARFNEDLTEILDEALNAEDPEDRAALNAEAASVIDGFLKDLDADPVITLLDTNPFVPVAIHKTLSSTLKTLASKLS